MSQRDNPYNKAVMENFPSTVKTDCVFGDRFVTKEAAKKLFANVYLGSTILRDIIPELVWKSPIAIGVKCWIRVHE